MPEFIFQYRVFIKLNISHPFLVVIAIIVSRGGLVRNLFRYAHFRNLRNKEICCGNAL
jgi:hypothetical protein